MNRTPLHMAVQQQNIEIIKLLLSRKDINVNIEDEIFNDCYEVIILFLMILIS